MNKKRLVTQEEEIFFSPSHRWNFFFFILVGLESNMDKAFERMRTNLHHDHCLQFTERVT